MPEQAHTFFSFPQSITRPSLHSFPPSVVTLFAAPVGQNNMSTSSVSSLATSAVISAAMNTLASSPDSSQKRASNQVLVGAVIGGIVGVVVLPLAVTIMVWHARRRRKVPATLDEKPRDSTTIVSYHFPPRSSFYAAANSPLNSPSTPSFLPPRKQSNPFTDGLCSERAPSLSDDSPPNAESSEPSARDSEATLPKTEQSEVHEDPCETVRRSYDTPTNTDFDARSYAGTPVFPVDLDEFPPPPVNGFQTWITSNSSMT
ncbi:hypothetical protein BJ165DRAFT_1476772 [Panaeolus papilionaceus]|nr:hypothetical protein BJ165DRAFT_1476772 [Panaeolus papilionaceus]